MLSIIISSYQPDYFSLLEQNIAETCGVKYEIIKVHNPGIMGTCAAYNLGAEKAIYDLLLFIHEDIKFHTQNWGQKLKGYDIDNMGVIGIAGGAYVPSAPCGWFTSPDYALINIIQGYPDRKNETVKTFTETARKALAIDGVFLSMKKEVFSKNKFDEKLADYHGYDTDITLRVAKKHQNFVISDILIEHFSPGKPDKKWFDDNMYIRKKVGSNFNKTINKNLEYQLYEKFVIQYFYYYPKNISHLIKVLSFFPLFKIGKKKYFGLLKFTLNCYNE